MNICLFYLLFFSCSVLVLRSYGRKLHFGNSFANYETTSSNDVSKLKIKKLLDIYPKVENIQTKSKHLFKIKEVGPKNGQSNLAYDRKTVPYFLRSNNLDKKSKIVSTEIGKHLIKITSALQTKSLAEKQGQNEEQELPLNPKFSHVIEIIPIDEKEHTQENSESTQQFGSKIDVQPVKTESILEQDVISAEHDPGKNIIISSELESKDLELKQLKEGGYEISIVPKFNHTINIPQSKNNGVKSEHKYNLSAKTENVGTEEWIKTVNMVYTNEVDKSEKVVDTNKESVKDENIDAGGSVKTENVFDAGESVKDENKFDFDESVENEKALDDNELNKPENEFDTDELIKPVPVFDEIARTENAFNAEDDIARTENALNAEDEITRTENAFTVEDDFVLNGNQQSFDNELEGSGEDSFRFDNADKEVSGKSGRFVFSPQNGSAPNCTTPKGEAGQCRRIRQCLLSDALNNFNVFLQHLCLIRGALVGVCCPNNPVIEISNTEENATDNVTKPEILQPPEGCGLNTKTRIVGGTISVPHEWTWMVALLRRDRFYCGGVIINNWYVLTAAHCVMGINVKDLTVRLGEYDFNTHNKHKEDISVSEIKRHAQFVTLTFQHDIALLKLKRSIQYSKFVGSICVPNQKARDYSNINGTVVGWGTVSFGGAASPILRQVTIPIWKNEDCDRAYLLENINDSFMCAGSPEKGEDACQGDSGGPLMSLNDQGRWEVIGIVSWGRRCGDPSYPGVYTRVTTYLDWIAENAN